MNLEMGTMEGRWEVYREEVEMGVLGSGGDRKGVGERCGWR